MRERPILFSDGGAQILASLNPLGANGTFVVMAASVEVLTGYIDESVSKAQRIFTLSALVGMGEEWEPLATEWDAMLGETNARLLSQGRVQLSRYHASECQARDNEFKGWSTNEQISLTQKMLSILNQHPMKTLSYSIDLKAFAEALPGYDLLGSAYAIAINFLIYDLGEWLKEKGASNKTRVTLIHDRCDYDLEILKRFKMLTESPDFANRDFFTTCASMGWENCTPLQAADLFAYENMKDAERRLDGRKRRKTFDLIRRVILERDGCSYELQWVRSNPRFMQFSVDADNEVRVRYKRKGDRIFVEREVIPIPGVFVEEL